MIDIHSHLLPCLDDGAQNVEQSINIIKQAIEQGITDIIATPHYNKSSLTTTKDDIDNSYNILKDELEAQSLNINIFLGNEINLRGDIIKSLKKSDFYTLAGSKYVLLEIDDNDVNKEIVNTLYEIKVMGFIPILAHFERCITAYYNLKLLNSIFKEEVLIQVNTDSIISNETNTQVQFAKFLLDNDLVSFVASDCHNVSTRPINLSKGFKHIKSKYGLKQAEKLFIINPRKLIDNLDIQYPEYQSKNKKHNLFKIFK